METRRFSSRLASAPARHEEAKGTGDAGQAPPNLCHVGHEQPGTGTEQGLRLVLPLSHQQLLLACLGTAAEPRAAADFTTPA